MESAWAAEVAVVTAQRKKGSGGWFSEAVLGEWHPVWIRCGIELQQVWSRRPRGGPHERKKVRRLSFEVCAEMEGKVVADGR